MFSPEVGIEAEHIKGVLNVIADYLSRLATSTHDVSSFTYSQLQTKFPWIKLSRRFVPSSKLLALVCSALSNASARLPTFSTQTFFGTQS
jgi:hypothetical protein